MQEEYSQVGFFAVTFSPRPEFACAGWVFPTYDFQGRVLRPDRERIEVNEAVALSVVSQDGGGVAVLSWVGKPDGEGVRLAKSLRLVPAARLPDALLRFALVKFENVYMNPVWWGNLAGATQSKLCDHFSTFCRGGEPETPRSLRDDGLPGLTWTVDKVDFRSPE